MAEVVVERPETIFIGTANQVAKGVEHVWRYKLTRVGAERMALHMLGIWCLSWKKSWRETSGMWHMKGGLFQMRRASKSWRSALQSFVLRPRFGRMECMSGRQITCGAGPPMQIRRKNRSGEHLTSWFAHAWDVVVALQTLLHFWTQLLFGGAVWCMWCVCVWNYRRFASLDLTAFWRGGPMHWGRWHLQAQSCHGYYFCCVVWGKYRVCRAAFCVKLWMLGFGFDMSERYLRRYVRKHVERYVRKNVRRYVRKSVKRFVRKNVKRYVRKMSERMSEDMAERMSEDISEDLSERMSKDMSERTSEDCFQSVCEVESNRTHFRRWVVCLPSPDPIRLT